MKLKLKATSKDWMIFGIFALLLLIVVSILVNNINSISTDGTFAGINPFTALFEHFEAVLIFYVFAMAFLFMTVKDYFFDQEKGLGISFGPKDEKGFSRWCTDKEMKASLSEINVRDSEYEYAGFPLLSTGDKFWVDDGESHNIVIGSTGTGKTQCVIHPLVKILAKKGESMIVTDPKGEIYRESAGLLKEKGYQIIVLNFRDPQRGNTWNPLNLPYKLYKSDMETNMLSYPEAQKKDKRSCFIIYFSFIKTRHLLVCIFFRDFNSIVFKVCFFFFVFGICLGINAIFVNDEFIQNIYEANGDYKIINHIVTHIFSIVISTIGASIIKSIVALISFTDVAVLEVKEFNNMSNENKINQALVRMTSRISRFYLINIILMSVFWIYTGSICSVFNNSQLYLIINAGVSFVGVIILPILYYFIPAILRASALSGKDSKCLYKFSQFFELI